MAYGTPERPEEVAPYFTHIRGGRTPSPEAVEKLQRRYEIVGGRTPLLELTHRVGSALSAELGGDRVYVGMKHWHPFIGDVVPRIAEDGVTDLVAIALAPHYSRLSIGGYRHALEAALGRLERPVGVRVVEHWHLNAGFVALMA